MRSDFKSTTSRVTGQLKDCDIIKVLVESECQLLTLFTKDEFIKLLPTILSLIIGKRTV